jgi:hypothetical protein
MPPNACAQQRHHAQRTCACTLTKSNIIGLAGIARMASGSMSVGAAIATLAFALPVLAAACTDAR